MKRIITLFGVAVLAVVALTAIQVTTAWAEETKILPEPTAASPLKAETTQSAAGKILSVGGTEIKCGKGKGTQEWTSANNGKGEILFEECTSALSEKCKNAELAGAIKIAVEIKFWLALWMEASGEEVLVGALVFLTPLLTTFECVNSAKTIKTEVDLKKGSCFAAQVYKESLNTLISLAKAHFSEFKSGETQILFVLPENGTSESACLPIITVNGGEEQLAALEAVFQAGTFKKGGNAITIQLMNG
jgi:hypothetical protein